MDTELDRPRLRYIAIGCLVVFAAINVLTADYALNQDHQLNRILHFVPPTGPLTIQDIPFDDPTQEARLHQLDRALVIVGLAALALWVAWLISTERRLRELGEPRQRRPLYRRALLDVIFPVRVIADTMARSTRPEERERGTRWRLALAAGAWVLVLAYLSVAAALVTRAGNQSGLPLRITRDRFLIALGLTGLLLAGASVAITVWTGSSQRDLAIGEPTDTWARHRAT